MRPCGIKRRARAKPGGYLALEKDKRKIQRNGGGNSGGENKGQDKLYCIKEKGENTNENGN